MIPAVCVFMSEILTTGLESTKIMALFWTFKLGVEKLHPPGRRDRFAVYCAPLRMGVPRTLKTQRHVG